MSWALANNLTVLICCGYAWLVGGRFEKAGAAAILVGSMLTWVAMRYASSSFNGVNLGVATVDLLLFLCLAVIAIRSDKTWPLWAAGFHLAAILTHLAAAVDSQTAARSYAHSAGFWGYLVFFSLALGSKLECGKDRFSETSSDIFRTI